MADFKLFPFTKEDVINSVKEYGNAVVDIRSYWIGGKHDHFYVEIGTEQFSDNGKYKYAYQFAVAVQNLFKEIEKELEKENIVLIRKLCFLDSGWDYCWRCTKTDKLECVDKIVKIVPCAEFKELQSWLKKNAKFDLGVTDLFTCDVCQKRESKWYSQYNYTAKSSYECKRLLEKLKAVYKSGNKAIAELIEFEDIDGNKDRYEYEQYGYKRVSLQVRISTPTGRNERIVA